MQTVQTSYQIAFDMILAKDHPSVDSKRKPSRTNFVNNFCHAILRKSISTQLCPLSLLHTTDLLKMSKPRASPTPNARYRVKAPEVPIPKRQVPLSEQQAQAPSGPSLSRKRRLPFSHLLTSLRQRFSALPTPIRRAGRTLRWLTPLVPIALYFPEHVMQVMWVRGPSMTPCLNEDYEQSQTKSDIVLVSMWPWGSIIPFLKEPKLERGMIVTFR